MTYTLRLLTPSNVMLVLTLDLGNGSDPACPYPRIPMGHRYHVGDLACLRCGQRLPLPHSECPEAWS
jgi:hypothetical protein